MSRIIIIGGHGKIARLLEPELVQRGDRVTAVIRNPDHASDIESTGATPVVADVERLDTAAIAEILDGHDAVIWSAGAGGGDPERTYAVDRDAAVRTMEAAERAGVRRFVMVSYFGARPDHGVDPENSFFPYAEAKAEADERLRASTLDWTMLGPSRLTHGDVTGRIDADAPEADSVSRANVALTIMSVLDDDSTIGRTIRFNDGDIPVAEAIRL
ncbi:SDR family oxidoreductase [Leucobacter sp. CSA1]|uniref:SDR family oxidoreductase n=1 Tax=Leucobacter chromiisoli TaxID=2796471 RepID=A0A934Q7K5_9MICO|nr:SDR family oxidoreductase [Leucobacter chromiisoli]MBK0418134.1 SDR family oxidoreductase [Leucobacter chromiisoli]